MRRIVVFNLMSVDGYFAGVDGSIDWHVVDEEFNKAAVEMTQQFDTVLLGSVTYKLFKDFWPSALTDPETSPEDRIVAQNLHNMTKIVFSHGAIETDWHNSKLYSSIEPAEIQKLKEQDGKDIVIYGSGTIVQQLANLDLIDEYQLMVNPVILGKGKLMFKDVHKTNLKRLDTKNFTSGNILITYEPKRD